MYIMCVQVMCYIVYVTGIYMSYRYIHELRIINYHIRHMTFCLVQKAPFS